MSVGLVGPVIPASGGGRDLMQGSAVYQTEFRPVSCTLPSVISANVLPFLSSLSGIAKGIKSPCSTHLAEGQSHPASIWALGQRRIFSLTIFL